MKVVDVIKNEGESGTLVWKYPSSDFNTRSQLIVHESEEALFFLNGQALDLFEPGRYTLHTQNIPLLRKITNIPTGGESPFKCEVYFINKTEQMAMNWGMGDVNFLDPTHNDYAFKIGASGEMNLRVNDSRKLILKLVGSERILDRDTIKRYFKAPIVTHIKTMLPNILHEKGISIFKVESLLSELSAILRVRISEEMDDYGITLEKFWIDNIKKPENDPFYITLNHQRGEKIIQANQSELDIQKAKNEREVELIEHTGKMEREKMDIDIHRYEQEQLGYTYQQARSFDVMEKIAQNEGSGSDLRNMAVEIGMAAGAGRIFNDMFMDISASAVPSGPNEENLNKFKERLEMLILMKESGALTEEEFDMEKKQLINYIRKMD